jgi:AbrB family looped-hinge helix DNA binding protein
MKEYISSVSPKGQVTLPIEIRKQLGIKPKDKVALSIDEGSIKVIPVSDRLAESYQAVPALKTPRSLEEMTRIANDEHAHHVAKEGL